MCGFAALSAAVIACITAAPARAVALTLGFSADPALTNGSATARDKWIPRAASEGAGIVRVNVLWSEVAPRTRPANFRASDPSSPGYDWASVDAAVRDLTSRGVAPLLNVALAPTWAEGPRRPRSAQPGTWRPDATKFAAFATAAARRYSGSFPDPLRPGQVLPRVRYWQPWNEPNLDYYLSPQWTRKGHSWSAASPVIYRGLLNAFYRAVKGVSSSNFVVTAGTAPYGDPPGGQRMQPVTFDRNLFCLRDDAQLAAFHCSDPPHLDALSHHPYGVGGPSWHALDANDVAVPDIYKLARVLHAAERAGHALPRGPKRLWVTEISWDSSPPDPHGVPIAGHARWLEQALYVLWSQGVDTVLWLQIVDAPPVPNYASTYQAGLYFIRGAAKPAAQAFRFPFITRRLSRGSVQAWGRAPEGGTVVIEIQRGSRWVAVRRLSVALHHVFTTMLAVRGKAVFRAKTGAQTSLTWTQGA